MPYCSRFRCTRAIISATAVVCLLPAASHAINYTWTGSGLNSLFTATGNWFPAGQPAIIDNVNFATGFATGTTIPVVSAQGIHDFTINTSVPFTIAGPGSFTIAGSINANAPSAGNGPKFDLPVALPDSAAIHLNSNSDITFSGSISQADGAPGLLVDGALGSVTLSAANSLRGTITMAHSGLILYAKHPQSLGTANVSLSLGAGLAVEVPAGMTVSKQLNMANSFVQVSHGDVTFTGTIDCTAATLPFFYISNTGASVTIAGGLAGSIATRATFIGGTVNLNSLGAYPGTIGMSGAIGTIQSLTSASSASYDVADYATLVLPAFTGPMVFDRSIAFSGPGSISIPGGTDFHPIPGQLTASGDGATNYAVTKIGLGTLSFDVGTDPFIRHVATGTLVVSGGLPATGSPFIVDAGATLSTKGTVAQPTQGPGTILLTGPTVIGAPGDATPFDIAGTLNVGGNAVTFITPAQTSIGTLQLTSNGAKVSSVNGLSVSNLTTATNANAQIDGTLVAQGAVAGPTQISRALTFTNNVSGTGPFTGNLRFQKAFTPTGPVNTTLLTLDPTAVATLSVSSSPGTFVNNGRLIVTGGTYTVRSISGAGALSMTAGRINLLSGAGPSQLASLTLAPAATLDLANNLLTLPYIGPINSPAQLVRQYLLANQLTSSYPDPGDRLSLGYFDNSSTVLVRLVLTGDANLDGEVNPDDYALTDRGFAAHLGRWQDGDFNYDGAVTTADYLLIDRAYASAPDFNPVLLAVREAQFGPAYISQLLTTIPEPATIICSMAAIPIAGRRRTTPA